MLHILNLDNIKAPKFNYTTYLDVNTVKSVGGALSMLICCG